MISLAVLACLTVQATKSCMCSRVVFAQFTDHDLLFLYITRVLTIKHGNCQVWCSDICMCLHFSQAFHQNLPKCLLKEGPLCQFGSSARWVCNILSELLVLNWICLSLHKKCMLQYDCLIFMTTGLQLSNCLRLF